MNKRGNWFGILLGAVIIGVIIGVFTNIEKLTAECTSNNDCNNSQYCGADYKCHDFPVIEKTKIVNDYGKAATILGISFVIVALILRRKSESYS